MGGGPLTEVLFDKKPWSSALHRAGEGRSESRAMAWGPRAFYFWRRRCGAQSNVMAHGVVRAVHVHARMRLGGRGRNPCR